jgi:hypothetical protein
MNQPDFILFLAKTHYTIGISHPIPRKILLLLLPVHTSHLIERLAMKYTYSIFPLFHVIHQPTWHWYALDILSPCKFLNYREMKDSAFLTHSCLISQTVACVDKGIPSFSENEQDISKIFSQLFHFYSSV